MPGQPVYGGSPVVPILESPRCLCYCHTQGSTVFIYAVYPVFWGLPPHLIPCTPPSSAIFGYLSFILITWLKYLKCCYCILWFTSFCRWRRFLMSSWRSLSLCVMPRHAISNIFSHCFVIDAHEMQCL